jgi:sterol desaturase/sphingolipid hydroxylase (fatty acid hydroxylase superfamily)
MFFEGTPFERWVALVPPHTWAVAVPYAAALALVAAEVAWLARRPGPRRNAVLAAAAVAGVMGLVAVAVGFLYNVVLRFLWNGLASYAWEPAAALWTSQPMLGAVAAFVAWDLAGFLYHLVGHRTRVGWAAHRPHHTGTEFDATLGLRQTWVPFHGLAIHPLLALAAFDLEAVMVCAAVSNSWQILEHTSVPVHFPRWFSAAFMTPAAHRHHHGLGAGLVNLGPVLTVWDRLCGTWRPAEAPAPDRYGLETGISGNPLRLELDGWVELLRSLKSPSVRGAGPGGQVQGQLQGQSAPSDERGEQPARHRPEDREGELHRGHDSPQEQASVGSAGRPTGKDASGDHGPGHGKEERQQQQQDQRDVGAGELRALGQVEHA